MHKADRPVNAQWPNARLLLPLRVWKRTKNQVALSLRLGVPLAETLVLGVVACCKGNDHKTCLDCSAQLQLKGQSTPSPPITPSSPILLSPSSLRPSPIPQARNSSGVTAARPPSQDLGIDYRAWLGVTRLVRMRPAPDACTLMHPLWSLSFGKAIQSWGSNIIQLRAFVSMCVLSQCVGSLVFQRSAYVLVLCPALTQARLTCQPELHNEVLLFSKAGCRKS